MNEPIGIGSTIWIFDENHRVYHKDTAGRSEGGPIYREHWRPVVITGETSRSWIIGSRWDLKIPKHGPHPAACFTEAEMNDYCWANDYRSKVVRCVERCDAAKLRQIAAIVGYTP